EIEKKPKEKESRSSSIHHTQSEITKPRKEEVTKLKPSLILSSKNQTLLKSK
ncbi:hypothetical protein LINPERPRIM_LOCUS30948, partial [Linum perenne]